MPEEAGYELIRRLLANPVGFNDEGCAYELLQAYFTGLPLETLGDLLRHPDPLVLRAAVFVASELGADARPLLRDVLPLLDSGDRYLRYHAMEIAALCCEGIDAGHFAKVVLQMESDDGVLRALAMRLVLNAHPSQLQAAWRALSGREPHEMGLGTIATGEAAEPGAVVDLIRSADPLARRYGAIAAKRLCRKFPELAEAVGLSEDQEILRFSREATWLSNGQ